MSYHSSTQIVQQNTTVVIGIINGAAGSGKIPGLQPIPAGSQAAAVEAALSKALLTAVTAAWKQAFPKTDMQSSNWDQSFLTAPPVLSPSMEVPCAIDQINTDLNNWEVTTPAGFADNVVHTILLNLITQGGIVATSSGHRVLGPAQQVGWACATLTGQAGSGSSLVSLIGYGFTATML